MSARRGSQLPPAHARDAAPNSRILSGLSDAARAAVRWIEATWGCRFGPPIRLVGVTGRSGLFDDWPVVTAETALSRSSTPPWCREAVLRLALRAALAKGRRLRWLPGRAARWSDGQF